MREGSSVFLLFSLFCFPPLILFFFPSCFGSLSRLWFLAPRCYFEARLWCGPPRIPVLLSRGRTCPVVLVPVWLLAPLFTKILRQGASAQHITPSLRAQTRALEGRIFPPSPHL